MNSSSPPQSPPTAALLFAIILVFYLLACASPKDPPALKKNTPIVALNVFAVPVGLNIDKRPGPDSFSIKLYATTESSPKGVPIEKGTLEILTFDGSFFGRTNVPAVLRAWSFPAPLPAYQFEAQLGTGYEFTLSWGTNKPTHTLMSVAARYTDPSGQVITSRPSSVTVIDK